MNAPLIDKIRGQMQRFFTSMYPNIIEGQYVEIRLISRAGMQQKKVRSSYKQLPFSDVSPSALYDMNQRYYNVYFGVAPRNAKSGTARHVDTVTAVWVDLDNCDDWQSAFATEGDKQSKIFHDPHFVINTGGGFHLYWLIDPYSVSSSKKRDRWVRLAKAMAKASGPCADEKVADVARVMRVPGFRNVKEKYGDKSPWCYIEVDNADNRRYTFDELYDVYAPLVEPPKPKLSPDRPIHQQELPPGVMSIIDSGFGSNGDRNGLLFWCACRAHESGLSESECVNLMANSFASNLASGENYNSRHQEALATISSAYKQPIRQTGDHIENPYIRTRLLKKDNS